MTRFATIASKQRRSTFKALLEELGLLIPKTHDLNHLTNLLLPQHPALKAVRRGMPILTRYAVSIRYPGDNTTKRHVMSALRWATRVRTVCRAILGLGTKPPCPAKSRRPAREHSFHAACAEPSDRKTVLSAGAP